MDSRLVAVLSVVAVLQCLVHGHPQELSASTPGDLKKSSLLEALKSTPSQEDVKQPVIEEKKESPDTTKINPNVSGAKLRVTFPEDSKQLLAAKEDKDDSSRSKKSISKDGMMGFGHGPTTTVCIQVRSDNHPQVICGPPAEEKREEQPQPAARFASPYEYSRAAQYSPPPPRMYPMMSMAPSRMPIMSPYPMRRTAVEESLKPQLQQATLSAEVPLRVMSPASMVMPMSMPTQYVQPIMSVAPQASLLRLNCQTDNGAYYNPALLRSSASMIMGYYPVDDKVIIDPAAARMQYSPSAPLAPRMMADDSQSYFMDQAMPSGFSPYAMDPWSSSLYGMQGRSAGEEDMANKFWEQQNMMNSMAYPESPMRASMQEEEMLQARQRLMELQSKLRSVQQVTAELQNAKDSATSKDLDASTNIQKKEQLSRTSKRQTKKI